MKRYLIIRSNGDCRVIASHPNLRWDEVAFRLNIKIPPAWGEVLSDINVSIPDGAVEIVVDPEFFGKQVEGEENHG